MELNCVATVSGAYLGPEKKGINTRFSVSKYHLKFVTNPCCSLIEEEELIIKHPIRILIAEDNAVNQVLFQSFLENMGLEAKIVENGQKAVEALKEADFDLVFMDIQMPVLNGLETTKELLKKGYDKPIIAMTANMLSDDVKTYLDAGMKSCIPKPFEVKDIVDAIRKAMQTSS